MNGNHLKVESIGEPLRAELAKLGMAGGMFSTTRTATGEFELYVARNPQGDEVKVPAAVAGRLLDAAAETMGGDLKVAQYLVPEFAQPGTPADYVPAMYGANKPKREEYPGDEPAYFRELVKWEQARGVAPGLAGLVGKAG